MASWSIGRYEVTPRQDVRIGTSERERTATLLSQHLTAGRLELDEFDGRVKAAYAARTERDLAVLLADLPGPEPRGRRRRRLPANRFLLALVLLAALGIVLTFAAFPPLLVIPVLFLVLRRRHRRFRVATAAPWQVGRG